VDRAELKVLSDQKAGSVVLQPGSDSPATTPPSSIAPSTPRVQPPSIADYELIERIGSGAYGEVWRARSAATGALRAVKIVHRATFTDDRPFQREFEGIKQFEEISRSHPSQLAIFHVGLNEAAGCFYYVMELADAGEMKNEEVRMQKTQPAQSCNPVSSFCILNSSFESYTPHTLRHELQTHTRLPVARVVELGLGLTEALAHLHEHGLVHRDIKPSNIIFVGGRPKLGDIGLVTQTVVGDDTRSIVGTEGYLAPEGPGTPQGDLFALGKVLYEALTGLDRRQFPALPEDLPRLPERRMLLEFNEILLKACAQDTRQRYASAAAMRADLERLHQGKSVRWRRSIEHSVHFAKRALPIAAVAALSAAWLLWVRSNDTTNQRSNASTPASVFVLPFRNNGTNGNDGGLADRATDAFIESLKQIKGAAVAPRQEELGRRPETEARAEAAKRFAVRYVLAGNLKTGDTNTLALTLHDLVSDRMVWSQSFTGTTERLVPMETEAIRALAKALHIAITPDVERRIGQKLSNNLAAWKLVQEADKVSYSARNEVSASLRQYNEALQLDPDYFGALAGKAQLLRNLAADRAPDDIWPEIKACGERMLQIDPTSSMGQYFLWATKFLFEWDWEGAEEIFQERRARHLDWPVMVAVYLRMVGRLDEARVEQEKVKGLDQRNVVVRQHTTSAAFVERDYRKTIELAREFQAVFPGSGYGWDWLFHAYYHLGQFEQALETIRQRRKVFDEPLSMALEACALAKMGRGKLRGNSCPIWRQSPTAMSMRIRWRGFTWRSATNPPLWPSSGRRASSARNLSCLRKCWRADCAPIPSWTNCARNRSFKNCSS
jgi:serine/threonine protein kinase